MGVKTISNTHSKSNKQGTSYLDSGVDIQLGNSLVNKIKPLAASTNRPGMVAGIGGFGALFDLKATGFIDPILVAATDGVGTKLKIAAEVDSHSTIGIDLVAMCVNDLVVQSAEPLFFLDYFATSRLETEVAFTVLDGITQGCIQAGCALIGGETAEMPGVYSPKEYDLAGFAVGAVERDSILPRKDIKQDDVVIGLLSNGLHSNGFSLVREIIRRAEIKLSTPAPFDKSTPLSDILLKPTRIYTRSCLACIRENNVKALAHITGGGLIENIPRILPKKLGVEFYERSWDTPPIFEWLAETGNLSTKELLHTFNCGIGMAMIVGPEMVDETLLNLKQLGETAFPIASIINVKGSKTKLIIDKLESSLL
ncbi:MAG: phosphoribosylformylglycinamidine cyclo-ligase [Pseudomonadota bacterium]|nr:phosphoribosylformylglycinamidine cyclo-ligase [Pseudomonadota bacterium]